MIRKVGKILIPYDNQKLAELTRMDFDTVTVAMDLLQKIGLIQILENGEIYINQLEELIGSKSIGAFKKQQQRLLGGQMSATCPPNCPPKIDIDIEIEKDIEKKNKKENKFIKPTVEEIQKYCQERNNDVDYQKFYDFYEAKGWMVGKNKMKDWKASVRTWERNSKEQKNQIEWELIE